MSRKTIYSISLALMVLTATHRIAHAGPEQVMTEKIDTSMSENSKVGIMPASLKSFVSGSYQQILANNTGHPFLLALWSVNCVSCMKDLALLNQIHKEQPKLKIILLATDDLSAGEEIHQILEKIDLSDLENWVYAEENTQKLNFEMDPKWYGEIPRTYFFDAAHQREGVSGVLSKKDYETRIKKILP